MKILLLCDSFNCLTQAIWADLTDRKHDVSVEFALSPQVMLDAVAMFQPELIIAPMLTKKIPADIWQKITCLVVHPGIVGDRGPSSLDWAILEGLGEWGVTILEASEEMDAGDIWWSEQFPMSDRSKSSLYRREVVRLARQGVLSCVQQFLDKSFKPRPLDYSQKDVLGRLRPAMKQQDRRINWEVDSTNAIIKKICCGDSQPGALALLAGQDFHLFNVSQGPPALEGKAGHILAKNGRSVRVATRDGSIFVGHLRPKGLCRDTIKLNASHLLPSQDIAQEKGRSEIFYERTNDVALLSFEFYNGAMGIAQCEELCTVYERLIEDKPRAVVLMGGAEFFSNGIDLNAIQAADDPAEEAWQNILVMNRFVKTVLCTKDILTISMLRANAGAGGAMMALAADLVWAHKDAIINPHYKSMGGLHGSELWTYTLPKRVGQEMAHRLTESLLPISAPSAQAIGLLDHVFDGDKTNLRVKIKEVLGTSACADLLVEKNKNINSPDWLGKIEACEAQELSLMRQSFFEEKSAFHEARRNFVHKIIPLQTPLHLAKHRR